MPRILSIKLSLYWEITFVRIITNKTNWPLVPAPQLDQFSGSTASSALLLPRMRGHRDRLMKRGILYRPSTKKHKTRGERGGVETCRAVMISSPGTSTSIHSPHCVCTWALYTNCPRIDSVCWVNIDWGETYLLITAIQIKDCVGRGRRAERVRVWEMS